LSHERDKHKGVTVGKSLTNIRIAPKLSNRAGPRHRVNILGPIGERFGRASDSFLDRAPHCRTSRGSPGR
jgi:hypothetical protein